MVALLSLVLTLFLATGSTASLIYVDALSSGFAPTGASDTPFNDLETPLMTLQSSDLQLSLQPHFSPVTYSLLTLGTHTSISFLCQGNVIDIGAILIVAVGISAEFDTCVLHSEVVSEFLVSVTGSVKLSFCIVENFQTIGFLLRGSLMIDSCTVKNNQNSLIVALYFGFTLTMNSSVIQENSSGQGTFLLFKLGVMQGSAVNTTIVLQNSFFHNNIAGTNLGSVVAVVSQLTDSPPEGSSHILNFTNNIVDMVTPTIDSIFLLHSKNLTVNFVGNQFLNIWNVVYVFQFSGAYLFQDTYVYGVTNFIRVVEMMDTIIVSNFTAETLYNGPLFFINMQNTQGTALVILENINFRNVYPAIISESYEMSTVVISAISVIISGFSARDSYVNLGLFGLFFFSTGTLSDFHGSNIQAVQMGLLLSIGSTVTLTNMRVENALVDELFWIAAASSQLTIENLNLIGIAAQSWDNQYEEFNTVFALTDCSLYLANCTIVLDSQETTPTFFMQSSSVQIFNTSVYKLHGALTLIFSESDMRIVNMRLVDFIYDNVFAVCLSSELSITSLEFVNSEVTFAIVSVALYSIAMVEGITAENTRIAGYGISVFATLIMSHVSAVSNAGLVVFPAIIQR